MAEWRPALRIEGDEPARRFVCGHCGGDLVAVTDDWKVAAVLRRSDLAERLSDLGVRVKGRQERRLVLHEWACPRCGSLPETNLYPEDMAPLHDLHVGAGPGEAVTRARPVERAVAPAVPRWSQCARTAHSPPCGNGGAAARSSDMAATVAPPATLVPAS